VRVEQLVELCRGDGQDRRTGRLGGARAVDQDVDGAEFVDAEVDQGVGGCRVGG
jgi:hypothetical protein